MRVVRAQPHYSLLKHLINWQSERGRSITNIMIIKIETIYKLDLLMFKFCWTTRGW